MNFNDLSGFVLAGGKSSRMKTDKAFLKFKDETFLGKAFKTLAPLCKNVKIVINKDQKKKFEEAFPHFDFVFDIYTMRGALGGIHAALENCETNFALILAVDLPFVTGEALKKLIGISDEVSAIVPRQNDKRLQPLCAVYRVSECLPKLEELLEKDESASVRDFLQLVSTRFVEMTELISGGGDPNLFFNVNEPADHARTKLISVS
jgi:molybdenum cofactor guanylyltransferase